MRSDIAFRFSGADPGQVTRRARAIALVEGWHLSIEDVPVAGTVRRPEDRLLPAGDIAAWRDAAEDVADGRGAIVELPGGRAAFVADGPYAAESIEALGATGEAALGLATTIRTITLAWADAPALRIRLDLVRGCTAGVEEGPDGPVLVETDWYELADEGTVRDHARAVELVTALAEGSGLVIEDGTGYADDHDLARLIARAARDFAARARLRAAWEAERVERELTAAFGRYARFDLPFLGPDEQGSLPAAA